MTSATGISFATGIVEEPASAGSGDVTGPASATDGHLAVFNGATGKIIKDGGAVPAPGGATNTVQYNAGSSTFGGAALSAGQPLIGVNAAAPAGGAVLGVYGGGLILLEQHTASSSSTLDFTTGITSTYDDYVLDLVGIVSGTNAVSMYLTLSTDGGSTWLSTGYYANGWWIDVANNTGGLGVSNGAQWAINTGTISNGGTSNFSGTIRIFNPLSSALYKNMLGDTMNHASDGQTYLSMIGCELQNASAVNAIRLAMSSGNIASGTARLYGIAKA